MGSLSAAVAGVFVLFLVIPAQGFETEMVYSAAANVTTAPLMVPLTLIQSAAQQGAVCLDGTLPAYHLDRGYGSGTNSWVVNLEGGGWCNDIPSCNYRMKTRRGSSAYMEKEIPFTGIMSNKPDENPDFCNWNRVKVRYCDGASFVGEGQDQGGGWCNDIPSCIYRMKTRRGSSAYMEKEIPFTGIMSNKPDENPDFFNWNRVKVRYCDGASFLGEGHDQNAGLFFRGERIWLAAMKDLLSKGMSNADQALLTGCSAGGLAAIHHCDQFRELFPGNIRVKCLADAGLFLDISDVAGGHSIRTMYEGVVTLQGASQSLPTSCTSHMDAASCFFPQNILGNITTPLFILNTAYDVWQLQESLAPNKADPNGYWKGCKTNNSKCDAAQIKILQGFRDEMLDIVKEFSMSKKNGLFINSCFAHCQSERQDTWYGSNSPLVENKGIAQSVGDWYFERTEEKLIDCPYPCDTTCHNLVARP